MVSKTPVGDVVPGHVFMALPDDLRNTHVHGLETADVDESVLLNGPPGSGKSTESVSFRLAGYTRYYDLDPSDVTIVTYRSSLAREVREKVKNQAIFPDTEWAPEEGPPPDRWMATGHAVAARASGFHDRMNEDKSEYAGMVDDESIQRFCDEHNIGYSRSQYTDAEWDAFHALYTYCKCNLLDVGEWRFLDDRFLIGQLESDEIAHRLLQEFRRTTGGASFEAAVRLWEQWKREHGVYDYYEQLTAGVVGDLPGTEYIIIDELHDAYPLLSLLFERWIDVADVVVVAGDPHQVCNSFSGASPAIYTALPDRVQTDLPVVELPKSHRVPDEHFAAAARVLGEHHNPPQLETAGKGEIFEHRPQQPVTKARDGWRPMPYGVDGNPVTLYEEHGPDIIYLARVQYLCNAIGACLDAAGIIYRSQPGVAGNWSKRLTMMKALETLERADGPTGLSIDTARALLQHTDERLLSDSRSDALEEIAELEQMQRRGEHRGSGVPAEILSDMVNRLWWGVMGRGADSITNLVYLDEQHGFCREPGRDETAMRRAWERYGDDSAFGSFPELSGIETKLWTMHAAKGDEAQHAAVYTGVTGRVRDSVQEHEDQAANESRTWYVALTRAKDSLHIVRDAFETTPENYQQLPDNLVQTARREAAQRRVDAGVNGGEVV